MGHQALIHSQELKESSELEPKDSQDLNNKEMQVITGESRMSVAKKDSEIIETNRQHDVVQSNITMPLENMADQLLGVQIEYK